MKKGPRKAPGRQMKQNGGNWLMAKSRVQEYITGAMFELLEKKD